MAFVFFGDAIDLDVLVSASTEGGKGSDEPGSSEGLRKERPKNQRIHDILSNNKRRKRKPPFIYCSALDKKCKEFTNR
jgi:hypothetical protein